MRNARLSSKTKLGSARKSQGTSEENSQKGETGQGNLLPPYLVEDETGDVESEIETHLDETSSRYDSVRSTGAILATSGK